MRYPFISGHEVIGRITALSAQAKGSSIGQRVGIGWTTGSPVDIARVLDFAARHDIRPQVEMLPMAKINAA